MFGKKEDQVNPVKERVARHLRAADTYSKTGKLLEAIQETDKALELDPKNYFARSLRDRLRAQLERAQRSSEWDFRPAGEDRRVEVVSQLLRNAEYYIESKEYNLALKEIAKVYAIDPKNYFAQVYSDRIEQLVRQKAKQPPMPIPAPVPPSAPPPQTLPAAPPQSAHPQERASLSLYRELLKEMLFDGKITDQENAELKKVREIFGITAEEHAELEKQVRVDAYVEGLRIAWRDGIVSQNEGEVLRMMREKFGITMEEHMSAEAKILWARNAPTAKGTILIVEDDRAFLLSLAAQLKKHGYDVQTAESVEGALESLGKTTPSLVLSDLMFEGSPLNGVEFYQRVRQDPRLKDIPFLLMSAISDEFVVRAGMRMGVDDFIQKPFDLDVLLATIEGRMKS